MGKIDRVLIVAPTSVVAVWPKEFQEFADFKYTCRTLLGDKTHRLRELNDLQKFPFKAMKVAVINYESTWRDGIFEALGFVWDIYLDWGISVMDYRGIVKNPGKTVETKLALA